MWSIIRRHKTKCLFITTTTAILGTGWWYRPLPDKVNSTVETRTPRLAIEREGCISKDSLVDRANEPLPIPFAISREIVTSIVVSLFRAFLVFGQDYDLMVNEAYLKFVYAVASRPSGTPLLTVSNHRSLLDEPSVLSSILPYWMNIRPKYVRYSLCAQEYCFNDKVSSCYIDLMTNML